VPHAATALRGVVLSGATVHVIADGFRDTRPMCPSS
jgi:hypothetical protein